MIRELFERAKAYIHYRRVKRKRRKLVSSYADVAKVRHDLGPGLSPSIWAYHELMREGLIVSVEDGDCRKIVWRWPEDEESRVLVESKPVDRETEVYDQ